jgi:CRISPR-associated endonuclease/helicase Cas3
VNISFWAKTTPDGRPGITVFQHMINVGCVAKCIADLAPGFLSRFNLDSSLIGALAALHDLGKISPGFQRKCEMWLKENGLFEIARNGCWDTGTEADHGKVSHAAIQGFLVEQGCVRKVAKYVAAVLGAHHGRLKYLPNDRGISPSLIAPITESSSGIRWEIQRREYAKQVWDFFGVENCSEQFLSGNSAAIWWLAGLTSVADWIGSDERFFSPEVKEESNSSPVNNARLALESIGFIPPVVTQNLTFEQLFGFPPNDMQQKALSAITGPGVYVIEAPMGMGKTEAALGAAYQLLSAGKASGIYFALPTQATSNRIHIRINEFLQKICPSTIGSQIIHANSWLLKDKPDFNPVKTEGKEQSTGDARNGRDWFASAKRALIAPFGVGTVDQALLGVVAAKHFFVRHFALAGKVVVLDEVHSYDLYTGTLIDKLITTLEGLGCTVIVLSATLTEKRREQIITGGTDEGLEPPYPLISGRVEGEPFVPVAASPPKSREIVVDFNTAAAAIEEALALARMGGTVLWICNTVDAAQSCFKLLKQRVQNQFPLGLLHSRFPYWQREKLENIWMERFGKNGETRCGSILVSTQVVEQSVDLDADLLITELAPTDMLLQRLGRLWRHERQNRPVTSPRVLIIAESLNLEDFKQLTPGKIKKRLGSKAFVYDPYILLRSLEVWRNRNEITIPNDIRTAIEATYLEREGEPESWQELFFENEANSIAYRQRAQMSSNIWQAALEDREGVQTRLSELPTVAMILCCSMTDREMQFMDGTTAVLSGDDFVFATAKSIHRNLVKVPEYCFSCVVSCATLEKYLFGSQCVGIVDAEGNVTVNGLKDKYRLHYTDELGLFIEKSSAKEEV